MHTTKDKDTTSLRAHSLAGATLLAVCSACGAADEPLETVESHGSLESAIYGSNEVGNAFYGSIGITFPDGRRCSGVLLNNHVLLTAAHCLQPANAAGDRLPLFGNGEMEVTLRYDAPNGEGFASLKRTMFFYTHEGYTGVLRDHPDSDVAVAGTKDSFGLGGNVHFAMLRKDSPQVGNLLGASGYGRGDGGLSNPGGAPAWLHVRVDSQNSKSMSWSSRIRSAGLCSGDSGSMMGTASGVFFPSGASGGNDTVFWAVSHLASTVVGINPLPGTPTDVNCNASGSAASLLDFHDTIKEVVNFWGPNTNISGNDEPSNTFTCLDANNGVDDTLFCDFEQ